MALVCFDDVEHLAVLSPFLTVVDQPAETFGTLAAELLLERIGRQEAPPRHVVLQPQLIIRRSCGSNADLNTVPRSAHVRCYRMGATARRCSSHPTGSGRSSFSSITR